MRAVLGLDLTVTAPDLATDALVRGVDSPSLRQLAGARADDGWVCDQLFRDTLDELGIITPDERTARRLLIRSVELDVVRGDLAPILGAIDINELIDHEADGSDSLLVFSGLLAEDEEYPDRRPQIERRIRAAATDLLHTDTG